MPTQKRRRRPGAGRKPVDPQGSVVAPVRFTRDDWEAINRLAKKHGRKRSKEIREAVHHWRRRLEKPELHVGALTCLIAILVKRIEQKTGRKWLDDPLTGAAVRENVEHLIFHFAPSPAEPIVVPPELQVWGELVTMAEMLDPVPGIPTVPAELWGGDWATLAVIIKDLGSGWLRNRAVWTGRQK